MSDVQPRVSALIPAAGSGERLGMGPKALLELRGVTLLERSIAAFIGIADEIIVALPSDVTLKLPKGVRRVSGSATRQQSVYNLLEAATGTTVLIHDAARPFLPRDVIERVLSATLETGAATAALPAGDTLILESGGDWGSVLEREQIRAVQTPQGFNRALLLEAHIKARLEGIAATDDAGLVARLGQRVMLALGDERLFKVTRPGDWALAEAFASVWDAGNIGVGATGPVAPTVGQLVTITEFAPAKVNLGLAVTGKLENGYHSLDTLFATTNVGDTLTLEAVNSGIQLEVIGLQIGDPKDNLVCKAAALYLEQTGQSGGVRMRLEKRLPIAAGLGGGSSDAAAALRGLARLYPVGTQHAASLHAMAQALGADVPFLLNGGAARGAGVGNLLEPIALPQTHLVLTNPNVAITAKEAYLGLCGRYGPALDLEGILRALTKRRSPPYRNDLELPVLEAYPIVQTVKDALEMAGLHGVLMSGSGSTCFGLARDATHAARAAAQIARAQPTWWVAATVTT